MPKPVTDYKCNNCGAPLVVPRNARKVTCPYCYTECLIEGNISNNEILNKENIAGGLVHSLEDSSIQRAIINIVSQSECAPLDLLDNMQVTSVKRLAIPAFWFDNVDGTGTYTYERGIDREVQEVRGSGDNLHTVTKTVTEWTPQSFAVNASYDFVVSGNKEFETIFNALYINSENPDVTDIEEMQFGPDVQILPFNQPDGAAFNKHVKPYMQELLTQRAYQQLPSDGKYRNVSAGGVSVRKDASKRILVGLYQIIYIYAGQTYTIYLSHDGTRNCYDKLPVDQGRLAQIEAKKQEIAGLKPGTGLFKALSLVGFILGGILLLSGLVTRADSKAVLIIFGVLLLGGGVVATIFKSKKQKNFNAVVAGKQQEIQQILDQFTAARARFESSGRQLIGLENVHFEE